jgi:serine protease Do
MKVKTAMSRKQTILIGALMVLCVIAGALLVTNFGGVPLGFAGNGDVRLGADKAPVTPGAEVNTLNDAFVAVSKAVTPQVVNITVTSRTTASREDSDERPTDPFEFFERFQNPQGQQPMRGSGSGVIVTADGFIITNNHVVESAASNGGVTVDLVDGRRFEARVVGRDPLTDLAVIKIDASDLPHAALSNSDVVQVGQIVFAVGNPLGLASTVTQGIVSATGRGSLGLNASEANQGYGVEDFIQTDAAINPGNSGGGLFNLKGELVGINSAIATRTGYYQGYGFAIPINLARAVASDLIEDGRINRGYIGVRIAPVEQKLARSLGLDKPQGVLVQEVMRGGAAEAAGLKQGDVILNVDDVPVNTANHLQSLVAQKKAGQDVKLKVFRYGSTFEKAVKLRPREDEDELAASDRSSAAEPIESDNERSINLSGLGMEVRALDAATKRSRDVSGGVLVSDVELYGEAQSQGVARGDVILSVDRKAVTTPAEFRKLIDSKNNGDVVLLQVKGTNGGTRLVALEVKK